MCALNRIVHTWTSERSRARARGAGTVRRSSESSSSVAWSQVRRVSALAQEHGVNANLLFNWRRLHLRALAAQPAAQPHPALLPVTVVPELPIAATPPVAAPSRTVGGTIEIEIGGARVRVRGKVDDTSLRSILRALRELA